MTKSHDDHIIKDGVNHGYSIRVGKQLPKNSANLAYVHTPEITPSNSLHMIDRSSFINENYGGDIVSQELAVFPDQDFLLRELDGDYKFPTSDMVITDEYSIPKSKQEKAKPLYYQAEVKGLFDVTGAAVYDYLGGYVDSVISKPKNFSEFMSPKPDVLLYLGNKIKVTRLDGSTLANGQDYKIKLIQQSGENIPKNAYRMIIYTNFRGNNNETYLVRYEKYEPNGRHVADFTEVLNAYPFFQRLDKSEIVSLVNNQKMDGEWNPALDNKSFAIEETDSGDYVAYAPSQVIIADQNGSKPSEQFKYRITAMLEGKFDDYNRGVARIGIVNLNNNVPNAENLGGMIKKLHESPLRPKYLDFINPHPPEGISNKEIPDYWKVDLTIHHELLQDYDIIFLVGYGVYDMQEYTEYLRRYLAAGGKIWIDNNGTGINALKLRNFLTNIEFSSSESNPGDKKSATRTGEASYSLGRYHNINADVVKVGYPGIDPKIVYGPGESETAWTPIVRYANNSYALATKEAQGKGRVFISNCGVAKAALHDSLSGDITTKIIMNVLLSCAERKWIQTPWLYDYVFHRANLFEEEYTNGTEQIYFDDANDFNESEIIAKKIIAPSVKDAIIPYIDPQHYNAKGMFRIELDASNLQFVKNSEFEAGNTSGKSEWLMTEEEAIPGWKAYINGDGYLGHVSDVVQRGSRSVKIAGPTTGTGSHIYWSQKKQINETGTYELSAWIKTVNVLSDTALGMTVAVYVDNVKRVTSIPIVGTQDWQKVSVTFGVTEPKEFEFRFGFTDGRGLGTAWSDEITLTKHGSVYMTPENDGSKQLYAYTVKPSNNSFDFQSEGFARSEITTYDRYVEAIGRIKAFTYRWSNTENKYVKLYSDITSSTRIRIRKSEGMANLGLVTNLLPGLPEGQAWSDRNKIFFEFSIEAASEADMDTAKKNNDYLFINGGFFNTEVGRFTKERDGKHIVAHDEIYNPQDEESTNNFILQAWTSYTTLRATRRRYSILLDHKEKISLAYPSTIDERDSWYVRIKNGRFTTKKMEYKRFVDYYQNKPFHNHVSYWNHFTYSIPEYDRQVFSPSKGIKRIKEESAEYVNENTIRVQNSPMYVKSNSYTEEPAKKVIDAKYEQGETRYYKLPTGNISKNKPVRVFVKVLGAFEFVEYVDRFDIDYDNGVISFATGIDAEVRVSFESENIQVIKRRYQNNTATEVQLTTYDKKTFLSSHRNWLAFPTPKIYFEANGEKEIVPVGSYRVDYETGSVSFMEEMNRPVLASFTYSMNEILRIRDYDIQNGFIYLESPITFKDDLYVDYFYEEQYLEYRGYYDEEHRRFIKLDLNPTEGHSCTIRTVKEDRYNGKIVVFDDVPTSKLINKEVYLYILPHKESSDIINTETIRHCFTKREWLMIEKTTPQALLLGIIHVREAVTVDDVTVMDARLRGGGLKAGITKQQIENKSVPSTSYWDVSPFDGIAYNSNGVLLIKIPKSVLSKNGGQFSQLQVIDIIRKLVAFGIYYDIEYVD